MLLLSYTSCELKMFLIVCLFQLIPTNTCITNTILILCVFIMSHTRLEWIYPLLLNGCQETPYPKQARYLKFRWLNETRTHNHLLRKRTLKHLPKLAKWLSCVVRTYLYGALTMCFYQLNYLGGLGKCLSVRLQTKSLWMQFLLHSPY